MIRKRMYFYMVLVAICFFTGCTESARERSQIYESKEAEETGSLAQESQLLQEKEVDLSNLKTDKAYKLFYGEWRVVQRVGYNRRYGTEDVSDIIGTRVFLSDRKCSYYYYGERIETDYPKYKIVIIPLDDYTTYYPYMTPTLKEIGITGDYMTVIYNRSWNSGDISFIVKDDKTMLMFYKESYLELKRIEHLPDHETFYRLSQEEKLGILEFVPLEGISYQRDHKKLNTDLGYKLFYGKWEVKKKIGESDQGAAEDAGDMVGREAFFADWKCNFYYEEEELEIYYPKYKITIIPLDENTAYFPNMPAMKELGLTGTYVTIISMEECGSNVHFIIKDDETLIMYYKNTYLELERIEHEPGYESEYHPV